MSLGVAVAAIDDPQLVFRLSLPLLAAAAVALFWRRWPYLSLAAIGGLLIGYAFLGRSFAYLGVPPIFVGELVLALGVLTVMTFVRPAQIARLPHVWLIGALCVWGAVCTIPYLRVYRVDALRDAALWGYSIFALVIAALLLHTGLLRHAVSRYGQWMFWIALWIPLAVIVRKTFAGSIPTLPGTAVPILSVKPGEGGVHLAGTAAFVLSGLGTGVWAGGRMTRWGNRPFWVTWFIAAMFIAALNRGGFLSIVVALTIITLLDPDVRSRLTLAVAGVTLALGIALVLAPEQLPRSPTEVTSRTGRTISVEQVARNVTSIVHNESADKDLSGTRRWRSDWWSKIVNYTVFGPYFWTGKGFGVNLAQDDQVPAGKRLRSPHNGHFTILARSGVPGAVLWTQLQCSFGLSLLRAYQRARANRTMYWAQLDLWILAYWSAFVVNASFDVFLEGPQGGIWFWCVFGVGIAALHAQRPQGDSSRRTNALTP